MVKKMFFIDTLPVAYLGDFVSFAYDYANYMSVWVQKIKAGDQLAYKELFDEFYQALCAFASKYLKDDALAADVVQDIFVKFWEHHADFDQDLKIKSYLYTSVRNSCLNIIRDRKEFIPEGESLARLEKDSYFENAVLERESLRMFYIAVETLPEQSRKIIYLAIDGKTNHEIALELNITEFTVHRLKKIAYKKLKFLLKDYYYYLMFYILL